MADIDQIIAGGANASSRADFSGLAKLPEAYWKGRDEFAKNDLRDAFRGGVPMKDGQIDIPSVMKTLFEKGDVASGTALIGPAAREGELQLMNSPPISPSTNRGAPVTDAPPRGAAAPPPQSPQQGGQAAGGITPAKFLMSQGIQPGYNMEVALAAFKRNGIEPDQPFNPNDPAFTAKFAPIVQRLKGVGQVQPSQPSGDNPPPRMAQQIQVAPQDDQELKKWTFLAASTDRQIAAAAKVRLEALQQDRKLTDDQKNAAAAGVSLTDYQNRADENTTQRDILTKSLIPRIDKSQETATAARDDIDAIHRARGELDQKGGVFSGAFADKQLYLAKAAELLGIPNADKIQNTEAYGAAIGSRVASMVKAFGSGTAISDGDRRFAAAMAGGQVTLDEGSMRRILEIGEKAARSKIDYHNQFVDKAVKSNEGLKPARDSFVVQAPGQYVKQDPVFSAARKAIDAGAPREAVMKRLKDAGHDPAKL